MKSNLASFQLPDRLKPELKLPHLQGLAHLQGPRSPDRRSVGPHFLDDLAPGFAPNLGPLQPSVGGPEDLGWEIPAARAR